MKIAIFLIILTIYMVLIEPYIITTKKVLVKNSNLKGLKIVFASDFHYKKYENFRLKRDVRFINKQNPDIIILGGDFVNGHKQGKALDNYVIAKEFAKFNAKYGTFAVLGNHDVWQDAEGISRNLSNNNIQVLKNSNAKVQNLYIAGVEDLQTQNPDIQKALKGTKDPTILVTHNPDIIYDVPQSIDLTLAGHLHGGQVGLPFHGAIITPSKYGTKFAYGLYNVDGRNLFVSRGIGTSVLPIRFFNPPEIVVLEFID